MKSARHFHLPLTGTDIAKSKDLLVNLVEGVTSLSLPFKERVTFIGAYTDVAIVQRANGEKLWINKRYCYFTIGHQNNGDLVFVDNRYLQEPV